MRTILLRMFLLACFLSIFSRQKAIAQDYLYATGNPSFATNIPIENGFINLSNGNLHMEFPLATHKQRGALSLNERLVYDSRIWMIGHYSYYYWWPDNIPNTPNTQAGWRFVTGGETGSLGSIFTYAGDYTCDADASSGNHFHSSTQYFTWADSSGTVHTFDAGWTELTSDCGNAPSNPQSISGSAIDASGYSIQASGTSDGYPTSISIRDSTGNQVYPQVIDRYGNFWTSDSNGNLIDDLGRTPVIVTKTGNTTYYDVLAPNGTINNNGIRVRYTVTTAAVTVKTHFNYSGTHEWPDNSGSGTLYPVTSIQLPNGSSYAFQYDGYGGLVGVDLPSGGHITYGWTNFVDSSNTMNRWLTSRAVGSDPATTYTPSVLTTCANYTTGCQEKVTLHKPSGDETVYTLTLNNGAWNSNTAVYTGSSTSGTALVTVANDYNYSNACNSAICTGAQYITKSTSTTTLPSVGLQSKTQTLYDNPALGKLSHFREWDYYSSGNAPTNAARTTDYTYTGFDTHEITVSDSNSNPIAKTTYAYTTSATATSGVPGHGTANAGGPYLQTVTHWLNGGTSPVTTYGMDDTGMVKSIVDPNQNPATTFTYQCGNSLPYEVMNAANQTTRYGYDCNSGAPTSVQDPNDLAASRSGTTYAYESGAGRPYTVTAPDGGQTTYTYPSFTEVDTSVLATPNPTITSSDIVDSFGRPSQHIQGGVSAETTYDANGRANCTTNPHFTSSSSSTDGSTCITSYDGLDRPLVQTQSDGVSTLNWSYNGNLTTSSDEAGHSWTRTTDAFGHLTKVIEPGSLETDYAYGPLGTLKCIDQWGTSTPGAICSSSRLRSFSYDSLARLLKVCNPEGLPSSLVCDGINNWSATSTYDANGNVATQTDARGVTTTFTYDALNRLKYKHYSDGTKAAAFGYDGFQEDGTTPVSIATNSIGRLSHISNQVNAATHFGYDTMGRVSQQTSCLPSDCSYNTAIGAQYDLAGNLRSLTYPDGRTVAQTWNTLGQLSAVTYDNWQGQHIGYNYAFGLSYSPTGAMTQATFGNNVQENIIYNSRLQPCQMYVNPPSVVGSTILDKHYYYAANQGFCAPSSGNNGNIASITDIRNPGKSEGFSYDPLNRLSYAGRSDGGFNYSYSMDDFGNMAQVNNLTGNPAVSFTGNNQMQLGGNGYTYDAAGNLVDTGQPMYGGHHFTFDGESRVAQVDSGSTASYTYDAAGQRVRKDAGGSWTEYVYFGGQVIAEKHSDNSWSDNIYANGQRIARADSYDQRIKLQGTRCSGCGWESAAWSLPLSGYTVKTGDKLFWRQYQAGGAVGGYSIQFTDGSGTNWTAQDTAGQVMNNLTTSNQWVDRKVLLDDYAGKTISTTWVGVEGQTTPGAWQEFFADMAILSSDGSVTPIYNRLPSAGLNYFGTGMTNLSGVVERSNSNADAMQAQLNTTYYVGDHLGTAQMEFAARGWPVWTGDFAPYGQEINPQQTPNNYKFTGLERDAEGNLNLDHAQFRQYSSQTGRWMSPDPYGGSMDLANPQSLNRYAYVGNMPLGFTDPHGLEPITTLTVIAICGHVSGACAGSFVNPVTATVAGVIIAGALIADLFTGGFWAKPTIPGTTAQRPNTTTKDCPSVPDHPSSANIDTNVAAARSELVHPSFIWSKASWFYKQVNDYGPMDYKTAGMQYENFGNFNYGAVGTAMGIPTQVLLRGAGWANVRDNGAAATAKWGNWYGKSPYGDDPRDQAQIQKGIDYARNSCKSGPS